MYPNPATGFMVVEGARNVRRMQLRDIGGREVRSFIPSANGRYSLVEVLPGTYLLKVVREDGISVAKIVIQ